MPYISNAFVSEALECARRGGVDISAVLEAAGIDAPGGGQVTGEQFGLLWLAIASALNDEFFGNAARAMRPGAFALMGHAVRDASTVEVGLRRALRFLRVAIDEPYGELSMKGGVAQITLHDSVRNRSAFTYRTYWVILHGLTCWLARRRIPLHGLALTCPPPKEAEDYGQFFGAPVTFDAEAGWLRYDARHLRQPAKRSEAALKRFLRAAPGSFLVGYRHDEGRVSQVAQVLRDAPAADWPNLPELCAGLGVSPATLRRQLRAQGTGFREIKAQVLEDRAKALLDGSEQSVTDVAHELGFAEPSAFFRAFRGWTGVSPAAWRVRDRS